MQTRIQQGSYTLKDVKLPKFTIQIFANNSTQRLAAVATSIFPLSDPRDH